MLLIRNIISAVVLSTAFIASSQNQMSNWDGGGATGAGSEPNNFEWDCSPAIEWAEANVFGVRFQDDQVYNYNDEDLSGRILFVRWDDAGGSSTSSVYSYPAELEACKTYIFSAKLAWHSNGTTPSFTYGINSEKDNSGSSLASADLVVATQKEMNDLELVFSSSEAGTYYFTLGASSKVLGAIRDLSLTEYSGDPYLALSRQELIYDTTRLSQSFSVHGFGLSEDITFEAPEGMTVSPGTIAPAEAVCPVQVTATFDSPQSVADGVLIVNSGSLTEQVNIREVLPPWMAPGTSEYTPDGTWCWFQDPRAVYYEGTKKQTYTGWVTSDGSVQVSSYNHETGERLTHTLNEKFQVDDHNNPTFLVREDGHIVVAYSGHFYGPMRVVVSQNPEDITSFGNEATFGDNVTYANPYQIGDSTVMFYRDGSTWHPTMNVSMDGGVTWGTPQKFISRNGIENRPYVKYVQDSHGGIHLTFTTGHPRREPTNKIYYVYYKNKQFFKADGTLIKAYSGVADALDIDAGEPEVVYDASEGKGWTWDIALDEDEHPIILYAAFPDDQNHHYYYARWDGGQWINNLIVNSGRWFPQTPEGAGEDEPNYSGGMVVDPINPSIVYLSRQVNEVFEIFKYTTDDGGASWSAEALTENTPDTVINVRPVIPRGHLPGSFDVMWMRGTYTTYRNYHTAVMYYSPAAMNARLDSIQVGGQAIETFHPDTLSYQVQLPAGTTDMPAIEAFAQAPLSTVTVTMPSDLPGTALITVQSEANQHSQTYVVNITLEEEVTLDVNTSGAVSIYPNPTTHQLTIRWDRTATTYRQVSILSLTGNQLWTDSIGDEDLVLNLADYAKGVYIVELSGDEGVITQQIIKR